MSKPFSIQSPENIAMEYGGNKQKIAQAMQLGVVDPTAGVLAGMFIDRMRSAQVQEQAPQATVAQQVMGGAPAMPPSAPAGGLGATSQAAPPMAPQMGAPAPMAQAPQGMAEGGIVGIDVPETMFDEASNGGFNDGYSGGGLVAFAPGGDVSFEDDFDATFGTASQAPTAGSYYGYSMDPRQNMGIARQLMGTPESKYSGMLEKGFLETLDPTAMEKRSKARKGEVLMDLGLGLLANRSPNFGTALGEVGQAVLPRAREAARLDKADQMFARKALADLEAGRNTQRAQLAAQALQMQQMAIQGYEAETGRKFQASEKKLDRDLEWRIASMKEAGDTRRAAMSASSAGAGEGRGATVTANRYSELQEKALAAQKDFNAAKAAWIKMGKPRESTAKSAAHVSAARAYMDAADVLDATNRLLNSVQPRGGNRGPVQAGKGKAVQNGKILTFDAKGNLISG